MIRTRAALAALTVATLVACGGGSSSNRSDPGSGSGLSRINHIVVIYQENWSFDSLYPHFPGANNLDSAGAAATTKQVQKDGTPYTTLPQPLTGGKPDPRFPAGLPVAPFDAAKYVPASDKTGDLVHRYYQEQLQIDGGRQDKYVAWTDAGGLVMSYMDAQDMAEGRLAQQYTMADNFYHAAFGGSFLNHFWLVCACTPSFPGAPDTLKAQLDPSGTLVKDGAVTPDGYAINTSFSVNAPHPSTAPANALVPNQTMPNIGDQLSAKNLSWAWYAGGWDDALAGKADPLFQYHHQPFVYFQNYADGTAAKKEHLKDETEFIAAARAGHLPAVSFVKPLGPDNEHPGYASLTQGQQHVADLVNAVRDGGNWKDTLIVITYDENGGRWDHVPVPKGDRWGPGTRVPGILIGPMVRNRFVDHTQYDTTSILATIEHRWALHALGTRDASVKDFSAALR